jgi:hypothetical protein
MINKKYYIITALLAVFLLPGCGNTGKTNDNNASLLPVNYQIKQTDKQKAKMSIPGSWQGKKTLDFNAGVTVKSEGIAGVLPSGVNAKYGYITNWQVYYTYDELWDQISLDLGIMGTCIFSKNNIQYKAMLEFDLGQADKDGYFNVSVKSPTANIDSLDMVCKGSYGTQTIPVGAFSKQYASAFTKGLITNMTTEGADITFPSSYIYNSGDFKTVEKSIVLKIKKY